MFVPHSEIDLKKMFEELSISSLDDLFTHIPETLKLNDGLNVPPSLSELESISDFENLESKNTQNLICFAGGGHYDVYLPQTVKSLTMRPEFMTSYTPYQAEISQGILQVLFEYQSLICDLTDMELANASLYDGATSVAEAISVAINKTKRDNVVISSGFNPNTKEVVNTLVDRNKFNVNYVDLVDYLFPEDYGSNLAENSFYISEIVREKLTRTLGDEIPYELYVSVETNEVKGKVRNIGVIIHVAKQSQKNIVIGNNGDILKKIGKAARLDLEETLGEKVMLKSWVKVKKNWSKSLEHIQGLGIGGNKDA